MGEPRLKTLEVKMPFDVVILGIDEHTACTFDPAAQSCAVAGAGQVTVRYAGRERSYPAGSTFSFPELRAANLGAPAPTAESAPAQELTFPTPTPAPEFLTTTRYLEQIARAMEESGGEVDAQRELIDHAHDTIHELVQSWGEDEQLNLGQDAGVFVELLISTRSQLRSARQFELADRLRDALTALGIALEDTPTGTHWKKTEDKK
jgi:hypothetical protein